MSYIDTFCDEEHAYLMLSVFEAHKKIADGQITPKEATILSETGLMFCIKAVESENSYDSKINEYVKYIIIKANSPERLEKEDIDILFLLATEIISATKDGGLGQDGEYGEFKKELSAISAKILIEADKATKSGQNQEFFKKIKEEFDPKLRELYKKAVLIKRHAEALKSFESQYAFLVNESKEIKDPELKKGTLAALMMYCNELIIQSDLCIRTWEYTQNFEKHIKDIKNEKEENKQDPDKIMLDKKNPEEIKNEVENNKYSAQERKRLTECLEQNFSDDDIDSFEKLLWLDDSGKTAEKLLGRMTTFYSKNKKDGWLGITVKNLSYDLAGAPKIPSRNIFWHIVIMLLSVALAAFVAFHPAVTSFFASASVAVLAIITIVAFCLGASGGGLVAGVAVAFIWIVVSYFIQKLISFEILLQIVASLALLIPVFFAGADISSHSKKAVIKAKSERRRYYEKLLKDCENIKSYIAAISQKPNSGNSEIEGQMTAVKYYDNLLTSVNTTLKAINGYLNAE